MKGFPNLIFANPETSFFEKGRKNEHDDHQNTSERLK